MENKVVAIIVAGGQGKRMNSDLPKQFHDLAGKPVIVHSLEKFERDDNITAIVVVCHKDYLSRMESLISGYGIKKVHKLVPGGSTRQESSYLGVKACPDGTQYVMIHDAVRPFVNDRIIKETLDAAIKFGAATAAISVKDTVLREEDEFVTEILDRKSLRSVQTPQSFKYEKILEAHENAIEKGVSGFTDDCGLLVSSGFPVMLVQGAEKNIKITTVEDLIFAKILSKYV